MYDVLDTLCTFPHEPLSDDKNFSDYALTISINVQKRKQQASPQSELVLQQLLAKASARSGFDPIPELVTIELMNALDEVFVNNYNGDDALDTLGVFRDSSETASRQHEAYAHAVSAAMKVYVDNILGSPLRPRSLEAILTLKNMPSRAYILLALHPTTLALPTKSSLSAMERTMRTVEPALREVSLSLLASLHPIAVDKSSS